MDKKRCENDIIKYTKNVLNEVELRKIKQERADEIKVLLNSDKKYLKRDELEKELECINNHLDVLINKNYSEDFLEKCDNTEDIVLVMGINPGGGKIINEDEKVYSSLLFIRDEYFDNDEKSLFDIFYKKYIYTYHKENFEIFEGIDAKAHWAMDDYLPDSDINTMIKNCCKIHDTDINGIDTERIISMIRYMQKKEKEMHKGPYVIFGDLLWYCEGNQRNIIRALKYDNENELYENIKKILAMNMEYYKPKMICITNAKASNLIKDALGENAVYNGYRDVLIYNNVPIVLSGFVSYGRLDEFSKIRLEDRIKQVYCELYE